MIQLILVLAQFGFAQNKCVDLHAKESVSFSKRSTDNTQFDIDDMVDDMAKYLLANRKTPSVQELAEAMKSDPAALEQFLLVRAGANKHKKSKATLVQEQIYDLIVLTRKKIPELSTPFKKDYAKFAGKYLKENMRLPSEEEAAQNFGVSVADLKVLYGSEKALDRIRSYDPQSLEQTINKLQKAYITVVQQHRRPATLEEIGQALGLNAEQISVLVGKRGIYESVEKLQKEAARNNPKAFENFVDTSYFNEAYIKKVMKLVRESDNFIVTGAIAGIVNKMGQIEIPNVDKDVFQAFLNYSRQNNDAPIFVLPVNGQTAYLDPILFSTPNVYVVPRHLDFNQELAMNDTKIRGKQIDPLVGLDRMGPRGQSQIFASPKLSLDTVATFDNQYISHILYTTGVITKPHYPAYTPEQERLSSIAREDHKLGGIIVEKSVGQDSVIAAPQNGFFHVRQIEYIKQTKGFFDLKTFYSGDSVREAVIKAISFGDLHFGEGDPTIQKNQIEIITELKPAYVMGHDTFNGHSLSHYDTKDFNLTFMKAKEGLLDVRRELDLNVTGLEALLNADSNVIVMIVPANHNYWLNRWLKPKAYEGNEVNAGIWHHFKHLILNEGVKDPYEWYIRQNMNAHLANRLVFLQPGESFKVGEHAPKELAKHGHESIGIAKPSIRTFQRSVGGVVYGHTHKIQRRNDTINMGTSTYKVLPYTEGQASAWVQAFTIVDSSGAAQIIQYRGGEIARTKALTNEQRRVFFPEGYPRVREEGSDNVTIIDPKTQSEELNQEIKEKAR